MMRPIYAGACDERFDPRGNLGLWYSRFFDEYLSGWRLERNEAEKQSEARIPDPKQAWVKANARAAVGNSRALETQAQRMEALICSMQGKVRLFKSDWHFATGLGLPHPVENGLNWHPTLGVPYLPGSGVKGLLRAWVECWDEQLGALDSPKRAERIKDWFGSINDRDSRGTAGRFVFFDALPVAPLQLTADVMTPHMGKWYEQGDVINSLSEAERIPADWHDPVPVPFLVVKSARLQFGVAPRPGQSCEGLEDVMQALEQALAWLGAGAKTAVGYGRFTLTESSTSNGANAATIATGTETWKDALIEWQGGGKKLTARDEASGRTAMLSGDTAEALWKSLSKGQRNRKPLRLDVRVMVFGNQATILSWRSAPATS